MMAETFEYFSEAEFYTSLFYFSTYIFFGPKNEQSVSCSEPEKGKVNLLKPHDDHNGRP